jgi:starvation-inducible DNA-binding protein
MLKKSSGKNVAQELSVPNDLPESARAAVCKVVNPLVADAFALYIKTKNFHWHMSGHHFREYHLLFDEQAGQIYAMIDVLAERVRKLGFTTIHSVGEIAQLTKVKDDNRQYVEPKEMVIELMNDNKNFAARMRAAHEITGDKNDVATTSILENYIDEAERRTWFLYETSVK